MTSVEESSAVADKVSSEPHLAAEFLRLMAEGGNVTFQTFPEGQAKGRQLVRVRQGQLEEWTAELLELNDAGAGVFWTVNETDGKARRSENITAVRAVFVDLDGAPLGPLESCTPAPHAIVESSPGRYHAYWRVADCSLVQFRSVQSALARKFNGDPSVNDLPRVMRLPGFVHRKGAPFLTRLISTDPCLPHPLNALVSGLELDLTARVNDERRSEEDGDVLIPQGGRHKFLERRFGSMNVAGFSVDAIEAALQAENLNRCNPPLDRGDVQSLAHSMARRYAGENGVRAPVEEQIDIAACKAAAKLPMRERLAALSTERPEWLVKMMDGIVAAPTELTRSPRSMGFVDAAALAADLKPIDWLVRGYVERDSLAVLYGEPGHGKSFVAIDLACSVATGSAWHGRAVAQAGTVFYIAGEGHNGLARRFRAWSEARGKPIPLGRLHVSMRAVPLTQSSSAREVACAVQELADAAGRRPSLIIVDTLARNFGAADENSAADMGAFISNLDCELRHPWRATVIVVHHSGKDASKGARGSTALRGAVDVEYEVARDESGVIRMMAHKMKDAELPAPMAFKLSPVPLPLLDEDGVQVLGAALSSASYVEPARKGKQGRGKNQTTALQALADLEEEHRQHLIDSDGDPSEALVKKDVWHKRMEDMGLGRNERWKVTTSLTELGMVRLHPGGYVESA